MTVDVTIPGWEQRFGDEHDRYAHDPEARRGHCYEIAGRAATILDREGAACRLVHGTVGPLRNPHAWVVIDAQVHLPIVGRTVEVQAVWDGVLDQLYPIGMWHGPLRLGGLMGEAWVQYEPHDVRIRTMRENHWGPWDSYAKRADDHIAFVQQNAHRIDDIIRSLTS